MPCQFKLGILVTMRDSRWPSRMGGLWACIDVRKIQGQSRFPSGAYIGRPPIFQRFSLLDSDAYCPFGLQVEKWGRGLGKCTSVLSVTSSTHRLSRRHPSCFGATNRRISCRVGVPKPRTLYRLADG